jgi:hypothetical protein
VGELATKQSWWRQYITNATFLKKYPLFKLVCLFEVEKYEEEFANGQPDLRDFRISFNPQVRNAFIEDLKTVASFYIFGNSTNGSAGNPSWTTESRPTNGAVGLLSWAYLITLWVYLLL